MPHPSAVLPPKTRPQPRLANAPRASAENPLKTYGPTAPVAYPDAPKTTTSHPHRPGPAKHPAHKRRPRDPNGRASAPSPTHRCPRPQSRTVPIRPPSSTSNNHTPAFRPPCPARRKDLPVGASDAPGAVIRICQAETSPRYSCKIPPSPTDSRRSAVTPLGGLPSLPYRIATYYVPPFVGLVRAAVAATEPLPVSGRG